MGSGRKKVEQQEFTVNHANPVTTYYDAGKRCFVCHREIQTEHPAFDIHLKDGFGRRVGLLFKRIDVPAKPHTREIDNHLDCDTVFVNACWNHEVNLRRLQRDIFVQKRISATIIETAINLKSR